MRSRWSLLLAVLALVVPLGGMPVKADHTPPNRDRLKWKDAAGADFNIEIAWTQGYADQGAAYVDRVRDLAAQDPSCHAGSCSTTSWSHWYRHRAQPYFGTVPPITSTVPNFDPRLKDPALACGAEGSVSFHWLAPTQANYLGEAWRCRYSSDPTRVYSSQVIVNPSPPAPGNLDTAFYTCAPGPYTWHTGGVGTDAPRCRTYDLMSVLAHEVGHVVGFDEYRLDASGANSVDPVCLNGSEAEDPRLGNNTNRETMCVPIFTGTERQRTPEEHEKAALVTLYPPTGPAPTITPATQTATSPDVTWNVTVPKDPARATSFHTIYGDGTYDTRAVAQGTGSQTFVISHTFSSTGTYTQRATIVETGASTTARTQLHGTGGFNGSFTVAGGGTGGSGSVTANGTDAQGVAGRKQTVSGVRGALKGRTGSTVTVSTGTSTNGTKLPANTYSINFYNLGPLGPGYEDHDTWVTNCMTGGPGVALGAVTVGSAGTITSAVTTFTLPASTADVDTEESAVCISDATGAYGNQAPVQVI